VRLSHGRPRGHRLIVRPSENVRVTTLLQTFETEIIWLLYRYIRPKNTQYSLHIPMLDHLITTFNITHTYFSSPLTCSTLLKTILLPFSP
jgi:hypothetical protein